MKKKMNAQITNPNFLIQMDTEWSKETFAKSEESDDAYLATQYKNGIWQEQHRLVRPEELEYGLGIGDILYHYSPGTGNHLLRIESESIYKDFFTISAVYHRTTGGTLISNLIMVSAEFGLAFPRIPEVPLGKVGSTTGRAGFYFVKNGPALDMPRTESLLPGLESHSEIAIQSQPASFTVNSGKEGSYEVFTRKHENRIVMLRIEFAFFPVGSRPEPLIA